MNKVDDIVEKLLEQDLEPDAIQLVRELQNEYGNVASDMKNALIEAVEHESGYDPDATIPASVIINIINEI